MIQITGSISMMNVVVHSFVSSSRKMH